MKLLLVDVLGRYAGAMVENREQLDAASAAVKRAGAIMDSDQSSRSEELQGKPRAIAKTFVKLNFRFLVHDVRPHVKLSV